MKSNLFSIVYTADHGYAWSSVPPGLAEDELDALLNLATEGADEALSDGAVRRGVVANDRHAAAFAVRSLPRWDSEGRAAIYAALVLFPSIFADRIDVAELLADPFFDTVTRAPEPRLVYAGPGSAPCPLDAPGRLLSGRTIADGFDPHAVGALLRQYGRQTKAWTFILNDHGTMSVSTSPWTSTGF